MKKQEKYVEGDLIKKRWFKIDSEILFLFFLKKTDIWAGDFLGARNVVCVTVWTCVSSLSQNIWRTLSALESEILYWWVTCT